VKVKLSNGKKAPQEVIVKLEAALASPLSESFKAFLGTYDGAKPSSNTFALASNNSAGVNQFIPAAQIEIERGRIENISEKAYPVAWASSGNYILIDENKNGAVFFWDHELPDKKTELAASFSEFLELLEPFDISKVKLEPGQVKRVWIDPEFLKKLHKP
jgi:hypothetical protein